MALHLHSGHDHHHDNPGHHDDPHDHNHGEHGHHHHHPTPDQLDGNRVFVVAMLLNLLFVVVEIVFGIRADSLSLLADAGHNFGDVLGLLAAWVAMLMMRREPTPRFTYGLRSSTILAALANAMLLMVAVGGVGWEAILRFSEPRPVDGQVTLVVALVGVAVNMVSAVLLLRGDQHDLNRKGAFLHMASDAVVSLGVALGGWLVIKTGLMWLDPLISLLVAGLILAGTWGLFRESAQLALQAVPNAIDPLAVRTYLEQLGQVEAVHDLHVWAMSTSENALTAHLVTPAGHPGDVFLNHVADELAERFHIQHATLQIELGNAGSACRLASDSVV